MDRPPIAVWAWRHPRPHGATGRCIGQTDLSVDPRRAKRLARRIQAMARRQGLPHVVHTSPLRRAADVGRWLHRWGWVHCIDPALGEMNFGRWEGCAWDQVAPAEFDAWRADFAHHAPGDGEPLSALMCRAAQWKPAGSVAKPVVIVAHAGWLLARDWVATHAHTVPTMDRWPVAPRYGELWSRPHPRG